MHSKYPPISIVWLKRDLRLEDHEALCSALNSNNKVLLLYVAENTLKKNSHFSERHLNFIRESLKDINTKLSKKNTEILAVEGDLISVFEELKEIFYIKGVYSLIIGFVFSASTIWNSNLMFLQSYSWIIGAFVSGFTYYLLTKD